jgi:hypothetical protein
LILILAMSSFVQYFFSISYQLLLNAIDYKYWINDSKYYTCHSSNKIELFTACSETCICNNFSY